ncbi:MAG: TonB-dependent receptor [Prevotella sp.]|nr:TonB-dependent receptor [Prevotella sp.]
MRKKVISIAMLSGIMCMPVAANPVEDVDSIKSVQLQSVQVVSTRAIGKTPMAFNNLTKKDLQQVNFGKDIPALLSLTPSVTATSDAGMGIGYSSVYVRGTDPTRINVTANGIPLNDSESSQLYWVNMGDFASSVESMQVQRGVGTSTNGAGAFGATINMQTENIGVKPFGAIDITGGAYGTHKETFRFGTGLLGGHWGFQGRLSNISSDGYIDRASSSLVSYFLQGGYFSDNTEVKLVTFNGKEKTYMAWDYASKADMEKYGRRYNPSGKYKDADGNTVFYDNQTDNYHQQHYQLIASHNLHERWKMSAALHYTRGDGYYEQMKTGQSLYKYKLSNNFDDEADLVRRKHADSDFFGAVASVNYDDRDRLAISFGGGWNRYNGDHYGKVVGVQLVNSSTYQLINSSTTYYDNDARKIDGNIYGKLTYELLPGLSGFVDLQYRHVSYHSQGSSQEYDGQGNQLPFDVDKQYDFFNPKFGLNYLIDNNHSVYASYAIAHKEPTRNDFEDMMAEANAVEPQQERLGDLEVGYKYQSEKFSAGANLYYMHYKNQFVLTGAQDYNGEMVARNIPKSYRMGIELQAALTPFKGFRWDVNATFSRNRAKDMQLDMIDEDWNYIGTASAGDTHLAFSPDVIVNNALSYEWKGLKASLRSKFVGEQYMTNSNCRSYIDYDGSEVSAMIDKYFVSDLDISYTFKVKGLKRATIGCTIYNIFNEEYETHGACGLYFTKGADGSPQPYHAGGWSYSVYSAQAPVHALAHLSVEW